MKVDFKGASTCGLAVGLFGVVMSLITMYPLRTMVVENSMISILTMVLSFSAFVASLWYYKTHYAKGGAFTYGAGIKAGLAIGLFVGIIMGAFMFCIYTFDQDYVNYLMEITKKTIASMPLTPEQAQQTLESMSYVTNPVYIAFSSLLSELLASLFYSLIAMIFLKESEDYNSVMSDVEDED